MCSLSSLGLCTSFRFSQNNSAFGLRLGAKVVLEFGLTSLTHLDLNPTQSSNLRLSLPCSRKPSMTPCNLGTLYFPVIALPHWTVIVYIRLAAPHDQTHQPCCLLLHPQGQAHSRRLTNICWKNGESALAVIGWWSTLKGWSLSHNVQISLACEPEFLCLLFEPLSFWGRRGQTLFIYGWSLYFGWIWSCDS